MKLLDVVALLEDSPEINLYRGQVGTIVEEYEAGIFEVEFSDSTGKAKEKPAANNCGSLIGKTQTITSF